MCTKQFDETIIDKIAHDFGDRAGLCKCNSSPPSAVLSYVSPIKMITADNKI